MPRYSDGSKGLKACIHYLQSSFLARKGKVWWNRINMWEGGGNRMAAAFQVNCE